MPALGAPAHVARSAMSLLAGCAVRRPALVAGASLPTARRTASRAVDRRRRPPHQQTKRPVIWTLFGARHQCPWTDSAKQRPAGGVDHSHDDLGATGRVEHDPVKLRTAVSDLHEFSYANRFHRLSLLLSRRPGLAPVKQHLSPADPRLMEYRLGVEPPSDALDVDLITLIDR